MSLSYDGRRDLDWRKSRRSMNAGNCTEVAAAAGVVAVRDSKEPQGKVLRYPADSWRLFLGAAKKGFYDVPGSHPWLWSGLTTPGWSSWRFV